MPRESLAETMHAALGLLELHVQDRPADVAALLDRLQPDEIRDIVLALVTLMGDALAEGMGLDATLAHVQDWRAHLLNSI